MMFKKIIFTLFVLTFSISSYGQSTCGKQIKIAIVDTGLDLNDSRFSGHICPSGHKNFVNDGPMKDDNGHGTFIAGLVQKYAGNANYCMLIYKYYDPSTSEYNQKREVLAFQMAVNNKADIINLSGGGDDFNEDESLIIKNNPQITFVVAAGNDNKNLDIPGNNFYPASLFYSNIEVVGNIDKNGNKAPISNYSQRIKNKEMGQNVLSYLPDGKEGYLSGTSMSTAIFSGKLIDKRSKSCDYR